MLSIPSRKSDGLFLNILCLRYDQEGIMHRYEYLFKIIFFLIIFRFRFNLITWIYLIYTILLLFVVKD